MIVIVMISIMISLMINQYYHQYYDCDCYDQYLTVCTGGGGGGQPVVVAAVSQSGSTLHHDHTQPTDGHWDHVCNNEICQYATFL